MAIERKSYVTFTEIIPDKKRKTKIWRVDSIHGDLLGEVLWFGRWRCYTFHPAAATIFNSGCLDDISMFARMQTREHIYTRARESA